MDLRNYSKPDYLPSEDPTARLVRLTHAKRVGPGKYIARCPAHDDHHPSLSITRARDGCALLHCFAGCCSETVLALLGVTWAACYPARLSAAEMKRAYQMRAAREFAERRRARAEREANNRIRQFRDIVDGLAKRLAVLPEGHRDEQRIATLYHRALQRMREAELGVSR